MSGETPVALSRRVLAYVIDGAIAIAVFALVAGFAAVGMLPIVQATRTAQALVVLVLVILLVIAATNIGWVIVYTLMQAGQGSVGQRAVGLRLVDADTRTSVGFWRALLRNVVWAAACSIVVGYVSVLFDATGRQRGWHDKVARAVVVDAHEAAEPVEVPDATLPPAWKEAVGITITGDTSIPTGSLPDRGWSTGVVPGGPAVSGPAAVPTAPPAPPATEPVTPPASMAAPAEDAPPLAPPMPTGRRDGLISAVPGAAARAEASRPAAPTYARPSHRAHIVLVWDDGSRHAVYGPTLFGRHPATQPGASVVAVRDETLSLSKTHFEVDGDGAEVWITDRYSTNGVALVRRGTRIPLVAGERMPLHAGDRIEAGDRTAITEPGE